MAVAQRVLLARPHAFIVNRLRPFLPEAGHAPDGARRLDHLAQELGGVFHGAIISTVNGDAAKLLRRVRERLPRLPSIFAGRVDAATLTLSAERAVKTLRTLFG